mmetsp:Transcript_17224/g.65725  ORF Transcript_17224/g.65725 Transcript_17224/m.65725 type:complete len:171 (-) Transcript_17224:277-789(-)
MGRMIRAEHGDIAVSREQLWDVVAGQFDKAGDWSSEVLSSQAIASEPGNPAAALGMSGRILETKQGKITETFLAFDPEAYQFTYHVLGDGVPGFVEHAQNTWRLESLDHNRTRLTLTVEMQTKGCLGAVMNPLLSYGMHVFLRTLLDDLRHFVETGTVSKRKAKVLSKRT